MNKNMTASPCVKNCCLNEADICLGCFRSLDEITQWNSVGQEERAQFLENSKRRRKVIEQAIIDINRLD